MAGLGDLLGVTEMVSNNVHFLLQRAKRPRPSGRWSAASMDPRQPADEILPGVMAPPVRRTRKKDGVPDEKGIPPAVRATYRSLRDNDVYTAEGPIFSIAPEYKFGVVGEVWKRFINTVSVTTMAAGTPEAIKQSIPPSFFEHDNEQLRLNRVSKGTSARLGECCEGKNCVAYLQRGNNTALNPYLTASQQIEFDTHGTLFEGPCLLDIRKKVTGIAMLYRNDCIGVSPHNVMPVEVPFYNRVNEPGGYNACEMIMPDDVMFMPGPMVAYNPGKLRFVPTATGPTGVSEGYIDQGALMFNAAASSN